MFNTYDKCGTLQNSGIRILCDIIIHRTLDSIKHNIQYTKCSTINTPYKNDNTKAIHTPNGTLHQYEHYLQHRD